MSDHRSLSFVVVGHVDHGKSTLIGRMLHDTDSLPEGKLEELKAVSARRGMPLEWSFVLDAFQAERDQAITIDSTQIRFSTEQRDYVIIDAPGHREFLRNMLSGAALADAAVLVVDGAEGVQEQTRRHAYLLHLLGLSEVAVVVNKMDLVNYDSNRFYDVEKDVRAYLTELGVTPRAVVPICAREGDNLAGRSTNMDWYDGETLVDVLDRFAPRRAPVEAPLRITVQDIYRHDDRRIIAGRVESGIVRVGDTLVFSPANEMAKVESIETWGTEERAVSARAGQPIGFTIDERLFVERGDMASHHEHAPVLTNVFRCHLFWFGRTPLTPGSSYMLKMGTKRARVTVESIEKVINTDSLDGAVADELTRGGVAEIVLRSQVLLAVDSHQDHPRTGRCVLVDGFETVGGGVVSTEGYPDQRQGLRPTPANIYTVDHKVTADARALRNGHKGGVIWLTGLSGAGKSSLAMEAERKLMAAGIQAYVLDGDNVRAGLNADLGFSPDDRAENIRRVSEVAALFADAGMVVLTAFISPYRADRERARSAAPGTFHEVHVKADLATCEARDPKGLYRKARAGEIPEFTGISAPYEEPESAELVVDTTNANLENSVRQLVSYILSATNGS